MEDGVVSRIVISVFVLALFVPFSLIAEGADVSRDDFDFFIEALQHQGANPNIIKSMYLEYTLVKQNFPKIDLEKEKVRLEREFRQQYKENDPHLKIVLANIPDRIKKMYSPQKSRGTFLLKEDKKEESRKRRFEIAFQNPTSMEWEMPTAVIREDSLNKVNVNVLWEPAGRVAVISREPFTLADFQYFGRLQGQDINMLTGAFLIGSDIANFLFSSQTVASVKEGIGKINAIQGNSILKVAGEETYDADAVAVVVETRMKDILLQRYLIDRSRGWVAPSLRFFDKTTGKLVDEYKSSNYFLHKESGLWFPAIHEEFRYDVASGKLLEHKKYEIKKETFKLNQSVADDEFFIDIPEGMTVLEQRKEKLLSPKPVEAITYKTLESGTLTLKKGDLNLASKNWLLQTDPPLH